MTDQHKQTRIFVGIDWGSQTHQVCVIDANRSILLQAAFAHSGTGLAELVDEILRAANNEPARLAVCCGATSMGRARAAWMMGITQTARGGSAA